MTQANTEQTGRMVPAWVGMVVVALCLVGGGLFIWWCFHEPLGGEVIPDNGVQAQAGGMQRTRPPRVTVSNVSADGIQLASETARSTTWVVRAGTSFMDAEKSKDGTMTYDFRYQRPDLLTQEQKDLALMRFRITQDAAVAKAIGVSPEQVQKLNAIPRRISMALPDADRAQLISEFGTWLKAGSDKDKSVAEKQLVATLSAVGSKSFEATKQKVKERVDQIMTIITPEQLKAFNNMGSTSAVRG